jgi:hypothetical protein
VPESKPSFDPDDAVPEPAAEEARRVRRAPVIQQASQTRANASRAASVPAAAEAPSKSSKTIEELLRDLQ